MSRILVTGGAGFIGSHVVRKLLEANHDVVIVDNLSSGRMENINQLMNIKQYLFYATDVTDLFRFSKLGAWKGVDTVIHLAAQPSLQTSWKNAPHDANVNILGTLHLLGLCQRYKVKRFVFASTSAVYAPKTTMPYVENDPIGPQTPYGVSKAAAERYIQISGLSYAILRLGNVYGPGQVPLGENQLIPRALAHAFQDEPFVINGNGRQKRDFVYVEDVAGAFVQATESDQSGIYNIASGKTISINFIVSHLWEFANFHRQCRHGPEKLGELKDVRLSTELAERILGWTSTTRIISGLAKTLEAWPKP